MNIDITSYLTLQADILPGVGHDAADALRDDCPPEELHTELSLVTAVHVGGDAGDGAGAGDGGRGGGCVPGDIAGNCGQDGGAQLERNLRCRETLSTALHLESLPLHPGQGVGQLGDLGAVGDHGEAVLEGDGVHHGPHLAHPVPALVGQQVADQVGAGVVVPTFRANLTDLPIKLGSI